MENWQTKILTLAVSELVLHTCLYVYNSIQIYMDVCLNGADRKDVDVDILMGGSSNLGIETNIISNTGGVGAGRPILHV